MAWTLFVLKKFVSWFFYPLSLSLVLVFVGLLLWAVRPGRRVGAIFAALGALLLLASSFNYTANILISPLERNAGAYAEPRTLARKGVKYVVVLGAGARGRFRPATDSLTPASLARIVEGLRLWKGLPDAKLITSGGRISSRVNTTARAMANLAETMGVPAESIVVSDKALDTQQEAEHLTGLLRGVPFALVTSAAHMERSMMIFRRMGLNPIPAPTDFLGGDAFFTYAALLPGAGSLYVSTKAVHEYMGLAWLKLRGWLVSSPQGKPEPASR